MASHGNGVSCAGVRRTKAQQCRLKAWRQRQWAALGLATAQARGSGHTGEQQGLGHGSKNTVQGTEGTHDRGATLVVVVVPRPVELRAREQRGQDTRRAQGMGTGSR